MELEALPPDLRALSLAATQNGCRSTGGARQMPAPPGLAPESALRLRPRRALPSAPVSISVEEEIALAKLVVVVDREK